MFSRYTWYRCYFWTYIYIYVYVQEHIYVSVHVCINVFKFNMCNQNSYQVLLQVVSLSQASFLCFICFFLSASLIFVWLKGTNKEVLKKVFSTLKYLWTYDWLVWFFLVWFYGILTILGYLMLNPVFTCILNIWLGNTFLHTHCQKVLFLTIQFSICQQS